MTAPTPAGDAAIKAALEAAGWAECEARAKVNECEERRCPRPAPCQWCANGAAAAIAAFLRALPEGSRADCYPIRMHSTQLADEVQRAAGGAP